MTDPDSSSYQGYSPLVIAAKQAYVSDTVFEENKHKFAGALYLNSNGNLDSSNITIDSCVFSNNVGYAGAISSSDSLQKGALLIQNSTFDSQVAIDFYGMGACIALNSGFSSLALIKNTFNNNYANVSGGVLYIESDSPSKEVQIQNNTFTNNTAAFGGVYFIQGSSSISSLDNIYNNNAANYGTGLRNLANILRRSVLYSELNCTRIWSPLLKE